jgi:hypothetical protein
VFKDREESIEKTNSLPALSAADRPGRTANIGPFDLGKYPIKQSVGDLPIWQDGSGEKSPLQGKKFSRHRANERVIDNDASDHKNRLY